MNKRDRIGGVFYECTSMLALTWTEKCDTIDN